MNRMDYQFLDAAKNGDAEKVQSLLTKDRELLNVMGQDFDTAPDFYGLTPLLIASMYGHVETVRVLLNSGANVNSVRTADKKRGKVLFGSANSAHDDVTALDLAYEKFHVQVASLLLQSGGETKRSKEVYLLRAIEKDQPDLVRFLLENGANSNFVYRDNQMPLHLASKNGHTKIAGILLEYGAQIHGQETKYGNTALAVAAMSDQAETARFLLENGANVHAKNAKDGNSALHLASTGGHSDVIRVLLDHGGNVNGKNFLSSTPLVYAASRGHAKVVSMLLENGADADLTDKYGSTPVLFAASRGSTEVTLTLLKHGANVTILNQNGLSPLLAAMARGHYKIASLILEHSRPGPDVNIRHPDEQWTPLLRATEKGLVELATILVKQHEADVNAANDDGWRPLHYATKSGEIELACLLLDHGANINAIDSRGDSPLNVAKDDSMVSALLKHKEKLEAQNYVAHQAKSEAKQLVEEEGKEENIVKGGVPQATNNQEPYSTSTHTLEKEAQCGAAMTHSADKGSNGWNNDGVSRPSETKSIEQLLETLISQQQQGQQALMAALVDKKAGQERLEQQQQFVSLLLFILLLVLLWKRVSNSSH